MVFEFFVPGLPRIMADTGAEFVIDGGLTAR